MDTLARCTFHPAALTVAEAHSTDIPAIRDIYAHYVETSVCTMEEVAPTMPEMHRRHHRCGIGQALLDESIAACSALKLRQMVAVVVGDSSTSGSIRLHESFGFRKVGIFTHVGRKFGQDVDTVLLQRSLVAP